MADEIEFREAINAVSDVIQNRPRPLREFDQIYMKAGDNCDVAASGPMARSALSAGELARPAAYA